MASGIKVEELDVPSPYDFVIVLRSHKDSGGFMDLHLQGIKGGLVTVHEQTRIKLSEFTMAEDQTAVLQAILLQLFIRILLQPQPELRLS